jgi:hypothetical protein
MELSVLQILETGNYKKPIELADALRTLAACVCFQYHDDNGHSIFHLETLIDYFKAIVWLNDDPRISWTRWLERCNQLQLPPSFTLGFLAGTYDTISQKRLRHPLSPSL